MGDWKEHNEGFNIIKFDEAGQSTEGQYQGIKTFTAKDGSNYQVLELINPAGVKEHMFMSGHLKYKIEGVEVGQEIKIEYCGKTPAEVTIDGKKQERDIHQWKVYKK